MDEPIPFRLRDIEKAFQSIQIVIVTAQLPEQLAECVSIDLFKDQCCRFGIFVFKESSLNTLMQQKQVSKFSFQKLSCLGNLSELAIDLIQ